ncbi:FadR/GntR family transcriptional regulator [Streptomyces sp. NPDC054933]
MPRTPLPDDLANQLLDEIIDGTYPPDSALPSELELAERAGVSRLTVREAIKSLRVRNIVRVERGKGTYVNPHDRWTALDAVLRAARSLGGAGAEGVPYRLLEARRIIEVSVAELAAARRTDDDLAAMARAIDGTVAAAAAEDVEAFAAADIEFHQAVLVAARNPFISALLDPLGQLLVEARTQTSTHAPLRQHAIEHHRYLLEAIRAQDPEQARWAMHAHLRQTETDLGTYVIDRHGGGQTEPSAAAPK